MKRQRIGQPHDDVLVAVFRVAADGRRRQFREAESQVDVGARIVNTPAVAVAIWRVAEDDAAEEVAVEILRVAILTTGPGTGQAAGGGPVRSRSPRAERRAETETLPAVSLSWPPDSFLRLGGSLTSIVWFRPGVS